MTKVLAQERRCPSPGSGLESIHGEKSFLDGFYGARPGRGFSAADLVGTGCNHPDSFLFVVGRLSQRLVRLEWGQSSVSEFNLLPLALTQGAVLRRPPFYSHTAESGSLHAPSPRARARPFPGRGLCGSNLRPCRDARRAQPLVR